MRVCHGTCDVIKKSHHVLPFTAEHHRLIRLCACSLHQSRVKVHPQPVSALKRLPLRHRSQSIPKTSRLRLHSMHSSCLSLRPLSPSSRRRASSQALTTPLAHQRLGQPPSQRPGRLGSPLRAPYRPHLRLVWLQALRRLPSPMPCPLQVGSIGFFPSCPLSLGGAAGSVQGNSWLHVVHQANAESPSALKVATAMLRYLGLLCCRCASKSILRHTPFANPPSATGPRQAYHLQRGRGAPARASWRQLGRL